MGRGINVHDPSDKQESRKNNDNNKNNKQNNNKKKELKGDVWPLPPGPNTPYAYTRLLLWFLELVDNSLTWIIDFYDIQCELKKETEIQY